MCTCIFAFIFSFLPLWFGTKVDGFSVEFALVFIIVSANIVANIIGKERRKDASERIFGKIPVDDEDRPLEKDKMELYFHGLDASAAVWMLVAGVAILFEVLAEEMPPVWFIVGICALFIALEVAYVVKSYNILGDFHEAIGLGISGLLGLYGRISLVIIFCIACCIGTSIALLLIFVVAMLIGKLFNC